MSRRPFTPIPSPAPLPDPEHIDVESLRSAFQEGRLDLVCVLGPTASGKTRYAVSLAHALAPAEILSADSRQVYRGMDIGTGKDLGEYGDVPYHLIDVADAGERYDLYRYQQDFERAYADVRRRGALPILCGGTGLYIQAVTQAYALQNVPADWELRARLNGADPAFLAAEYERLTGEAPGAVLCQSPHRMVRAIEVAYAREQGGLEVSRTAYYPKNTFFIGTLVDRETRNARIDARLDARLQEGLVEEVQGLLADGCSPEDLIYYGLEYKYVTWYVQGVLDRAAMRAQLATAIHQFAKRQMTFFRSMETKGTVIHWTTV